MFMQSPPTELPGIEQALERPLPTSLRPSLIRSHRPALEHLWQRYKPLE